MKTGTESKAKFKRLQRRLGLPLWQCVGLLESIWQVTARDAKRGDIGRLSNEDIAATIEWSGDEDELIDTLVETGWLDRCEVHRLVVHDWQEHCPTYIRGILTRESQGFAVAKMGALTPKIVDVKSDEKPELSSPLSSQLSSELSSPLSSPLSSELSSPLSGQLPSQAKPSLAKNENPYGFSSPEPDDSGPKPDYLVFPQAGGGTWNLPKAKLDEYLATYPFAVEPELRKAAQWLRDHPDRRPRSARGIKSFLTRWLNRASDRTPTWAANGCQNATTLSDQEKQKQLAELRRAAAIKAQRLRERAARRESKERSDGTD